jgi:hypothetical protein
MAMNGGIDVSDLDAFREEARAWLAANCPASMRGRAVHIEDIHEAYSTDDARRWRDSAAVRG